MNLLSVSQVTKQRNGKVTFFPSYCAFQDLAFWNMINGGRKVGGVYVLTQSPISSTCTLFDVSTT